ncbi:NAD(P)-binding protein [Mucilaginibacter robiniae]|uniref:NAD(P)-binding protein n=1 Tax=Mucilaginibacter robiniae TaxID=2728022 RepID=A0A7L5E0P5_9SPHI|nr:DsbA family protein [Mucilaginibacter robiniae]QJD94393.1 NAD(P)-binding protein [Mucilaginibacter robiniae]
MKVVIIGGGIAGLTAGILLNQQNFEVVICERTAGIPNRGHAFLMHEDGLNIVNELKGTNTVQLPASSLATYSLNSIDHTELKNEQLDAWYCIKRVDLIKYLRELLPAHQVKESSAFSHFLYEDDQAIAAVFTNGEVEYGDIFIGADGGNSKVRNQLFGPANYTPVEVKEIVGISNCKDLKEPYIHQFTKFQDRTKGLSFGLIPAADQEFVWFIQYDPLIADITEPSAEELAAFCKNILNDFPQVVHEVLEHNNFSSTYIWHTRDFDVLPAFHRSNVVLIGDAAHLALPFTSAGTTNALIDAQTLVSYITKSNSLEEAFNKYHQSRAEIIAQQLQLGRDLKKQFLHPHSHTQQSLITPLIEQKKAKSQKDTKVDVLYFTDPICSTCWGIQPVLRKLELEYGHHLNVQYIMGGLLPSWENYSSGKIKQPCDAAHHWEEACLIYDMPLDGDIWLEDPLTSSYTPSIAFKAAQLQSITKAKLFLRELQELVFVKKKNITHWNNLEQAAVKSGLNIEQLLEDIKSLAHDNFKEDLLLTQKYGVYSFPTLLFSKGSKPALIVKGYQPYEKFEETILSLEPSAQKKLMNNDAKAPFLHFPTLTAKEFAFLSNSSKEEAQAMLDELVSKELIQKDESKSGVLWVSKIYKNNQ